MSWKRGTRMIPRTLASLGVLLWACAGGDATAPPASTVADSAGVTIVTNEAPAPGSRMTWTVGSEPLLTIGTVAGSTGEELFDVGDALRLDDGRVLVANGGTNEVRVFDENGTHLESWGREGDGPGEFRRLESLMQWPGDSILAWDGRNDRMTVYSPAGDLGRATRLSTAEGHGVDALGVFPDGTTLGWRGISFDQYRDRPPPEGLQVFWVEYFRIGADSLATTSMGQFPDDELFFRPTETGAVVVLTHPFRRDAHATVWGDLTLVGSSHSYELLGVRSDGSTERIIRRAHEPVPITEEDQRAHYERLLSEMPPERVEELEPEYADVPMLDTFPAFGGLLADAEGYLWVKEYALPHDPTSIWSVFDQEGRIQGFIQLPDGFEVFEIGADYILGLVTDDFDIEFIQMLSLSRDSA